MLHQLPGYWLSLVLLFSLPLKSEIKIGAKIFTESVILAEIIRHKLLDSKVETSQVSELGGTAFVWQALINKEIDIYPDYTGTLINEIFSKDKIKSEQDLRDSLKGNGVSISSSLGFKNGYGLGMLSKKAHALEIKAISDLRKFHDLRVGLTHEFLARNDGFKGLLEHYRLDMPHISPIEHAFAFIAIASNDMDVIDVYETEAEIEKHDIMVLRDDLNYFSSYEAVYVYHSSLREQCPECLRAISEIEGKISKEHISKMNARVLKDKNPQDVVAKDFLYASHQIKSDHEHIENSLIKQGKEHLFLVVSSMLFSSLVGIALGIAAYRIRTFGRVILLVVSILQTIPSLALLVFMIPLFGIGNKPALFALFLYALLPIVRSTVTGLMGIDRAVIESANVIGLSSIKRLFKIELPMASRHILSGIKTAAIITIGAATLGALVGAGGYGNSILAGIRMHDMNMILAGAVPAALLAILCQAAFFALDKIFIPKGLRLSSSGPGL